MLFFIKMGDSLLVSD